jgi:hypothetical protein
LWQKSRQVLYNKDVILDISNLTLSDYSILIKGIPDIPAHQFNYDDFLQFICLDIYEKYGRDCIVNTLFSYEIEEFVHKKERLTIVEDSINLLNFMKISNPAIEKLPFQARKN